MSEDYSLAEWRKWDAFTFGMWGLALAAVLGALAAVVLGSMWGALALLALQKTG